jgi:hypothetical protein
MITDKKVVGPGLAGMFDRVPGEEWAIKWIKNSGAMIAAGDDYAVKIFNENGKAQMTAFEYLSDDEIKAILGYIKSPPVAVAPVAAVPLMEETAGTNWRVWNAVGRYAHLHIRWHCSTIVSAYHSIEWG